MVKIVDLFNLPSANSYYFYMYNNATQTHIRINPDDEFVRQYINELKVADIYDDGGVCINIKFHKPFWKLYHKLCKHE